MRSAALGLAALFTLATTVGPLASSAYASPGPADGVGPVWVHFTDKGLPSEPAERAAVDRAAERLAPRARARREKVRAGAITDLLDVPLHEPYVKAVLATGAELRTRSRWLNAVSVVAGPAQRAAIERLPFVARVRPVARARRPDPVVPVPLGGDGARPAPGIRSLNYGECASQILPIQVDQLHDLGLSGAGVLVTLMDTGFLRTHDALVGVNVVAEHDFINDDGNTANEGSDLSTQHNHGTYVLSLIAGFDPGNLIGPAYGADFALAKTEDLTGETPAEEDYWVEAAEWADSLGTDVISTSLSYNDWYVYDDMDGDTAPITIAADLAAANGIAVFASAGNDGGNGWYYIAAPADGDSVITVGAVDSLDVIAEFSSHGPTFDGRTKPDVCAMGVGTVIAYPWDDHAYGRGNGTSFSCPITAGVGALLLEARPYWTPMQVRDALRETATQSGAPDNDSGWGVIRAADALAYATSAPTVAAGDALGEGAGLAISPNPATGISTIRWSLPDGVGRGRLSVVDVAGREIRDLGSVGVGGGTAGGGAMAPEGGRRTGAAAWDGRDATGRRVASGIWFARLETPAGTIGARIVRIR